MIKRDADAALVRVPPPLAYAVAIAFGVGLQVLGCQLEIDVDSRLRLGGAILATLPGVFLVGVALGRLRRTGQDPRPWKRTPELVTTGVYAHTRNPMYVGLAFLQLAVALLLSNIWIAILVPLSLVAVYRIAVRHEEIYLEHKFGEPYVSYKASVHRWL